MDDTAQLTHDQRELLYKEYARLSERNDAHVNASFTDFKMYGAVGAILAWYPVAEKLAKLPEITFDPEWFIFAGFTSILIVVAIISLRDMLRHSIIYYYLAQMRRYESEIRMMLEQSDGQVFRFAEDWDRWAQRTYKTIVTPLVSFFMLFVWLFPAVVLSSLEKWWLWIMYSTLFILVFTVYIKTVRTFEKHKSETIDTGT